MTFLEAMGIFGVIVIVGFLIYLIFKSENGGG
jgi:hypothetical protein